MDENYTFEKFWEDLDNGFQILYTYMGYQYLIYKMTKNCYKNELISDDKKVPHQKNATMTLKRVKELFPFMEDMEYAIDGKK